MVVKGKAHKKSQNSDLHPTPHQLVYFNNNFIVLVNTYITLLCASSCSKGLTKMNLLSTQEKATMYDIYVIDEETEAQIGDTT